MNLTDDERRWTQRRAASARAARQAQQRPSQDFDWDAAITGLHAMFDSIERKERRERRRR